MLSVIFKIVHVTGISLWIAGLVALPFLYIQRKGRSGDDLHRLHAFVRALYVNLLSPAAFVAVASGTALIFIEATYETWFSLKLLLVAGLVTVHIASGLVILKLFEDDGKYAEWRAYVSTVLSLTLASGILFLVLGEPQFTAAFEDVFKPGALATMIQPLLPF